MRTLLRLFFPRVCSLCGTPLVEGEQLVCTHCMLTLPMATGTREKDNFLEKRFWGRLPIEAATSLLLFVKDNPSQQVLHQIKYNGNERLAVMMGKRLGEWIATTGRFDDVELIIPVPLHRRKELQPEPAPLSRHCRNLSAPHCCRQPGATEKDRFADP